MSGPLSGVKVLELSTFVAAPVCARLLADLGADVIKVEHPSGDAWRKTGISYLPAHFSEQENPVFDIYNSGKRHIAINLKSPEGMETFHKLLAQSDVLITNTRPAALARLGLSYDDLKDKYPSLIYGIILGYGEKGPDKDKPAFDTTAFWSRTGFLRDLSPKTSEYYPLNPPPGVGDTATGYLLVAEISTALFNRTRTGKGDFVRAGLYHTGIFTHGTMQIIAQKPWGIKYPLTRRQVGPPGGCYRTADDEWVFIANGQQSVALPKMFNMIGRPDLIDENGFMDPKYRAAHRGELYDIFAEAYASRPIDEWVKLGKEYDLPLVRMNHFSDVTTDEQAWANGYLEYMTCPNGETVTMPASPIKMNSVGTVITKPAPKVGAHTASVLSELGYTEAQIAAMDASGAVFTKK